jgi:hypothetical protein
VTPKNTIKETTMTMNLETVNLPIWLLPTLRDLMGVAERMLGSGTGARKKRWVKAAMLEALREVDVPGVPAWVEEPAKEALVGFLIEVVWGLHFQPRAAAA